MPQKSAKKSTKSKTKRTHVEATMTVKVNGESVAHPARKFLIAACFILLPLVVGLISSALTGDAMMSFGKLKQPPLAPPAWLFPVAWTILYLLMGVASFLLDYFLLQTRTSLFRLRLVNYYVVHDSCSYHYGFQELQSRRLVPPPIYPLVHLRFIPQYHGCNPKLIIAQIGDSDNKLWLHDVLKFRIDCKEIREGYKEMLRYPSAECDCCDYNDFCRGGCIVNWTVLDPEICCKIKK